MTQVRIAALCAGYGGLEMAVRELMGGEVVAVAEVDPYASAVLARHMPGVHNHGDLTTIDWNAFPDADVWTAGFPCQDISNAGPRVGLSGKRSGIWYDIVDGISVKRPRYVFLENVAAIKRRGLDTVRADLEEIGYGLLWTYRRASDDGAPHQRHRWFGLAVRGGSSAEVPNRTWSGSGTLLPTPTARDGMGGPGRSPNRRGGDNLRTVAPEIALLPTPKASDGPHGGPNQRDRAGNWMLPGLAHRLDREWVCVDGRDFGPAIRRWESTLGREAPEPSETGPRGGRRLAAPFAEWMMGLDPGRVTGTPGLDRNQTIKIIGNGAVPQQAASAYRALLDHCAAVTLPAQRSA